MVEPARASSTRNRGSRIAAVVRPTLQRAVLWCLHPAGDRTAPDSPSTTAPSAPPPSSKAVNPLAVTSPAVISPAGNDPVPSPAAPVVAVRLLGPFELTVNGITVVEWHGRLGPLVLRFVLAQPGRRCSRDMLIEQFWPYADPGRARNRLHVAISSLRRAVKALSDVPILEHHEGWYRVSPEVELVLDTDELDRFHDEANRHRRRGDTARELDALRAAVDLYRGDYLADVPYEEWAFPERAARQASHVRALERLAALAEEHRRFDDAADAASRLVRIDPCCEEAHRTLMRCHAHHRRLTEVVRQFEACRRSLADLGVAPSPETIALYRALRSGLSIGCELSPAG